MANLLRNFPERFLSFLKEGRFKGMVRIKKSPSSPPLKKGENRARIVQFLPIINSPKNW
jgi:hypothetical protein